MSSNSDSDSTNHNLNNLNQETNNSSFNSDQNDALDLEPVEPLNENLAQNEPINDNEIQVFEDANDINNNEFELYFVNESDDDEEQYYEYDQDDDDDVDDDTDEDEDQQDMEEEEDDDYQDTIQDNQDEYENVEVPSTITYNTELPSTHNYLGQNFQEISSSRHIHESNDEIQIPLLALPGNSFYENDSDNCVQLIPGQVMPIYFYSPIQIQIIRKRMNENNPSIGFVLCPKSLRVPAENTNTANLNIDDDNSNDQEDGKLGILAEILSASHQNENHEITDFSSLIESAGGLILKVKGRERFRILKVRKDITGTVIGTVRILPEYALTTNPLLKQASFNLAHNFEAFLHKNKNSNSKCSLAKAEYLNTQLNLPAWLYRNYDCDYLIYLIKKELNDTFRQQVTITENQSGLENDSNNSIAFCSWLLTNFPFDNKMRINCLKMNCINQRLMYMYSLLKNFTNINCRLCHNQFCTKSDAFSISKQGFMGAFLNPGGVVHETLTVYKLKNFHIVSQRPSTQHSWFPGYAWQIITCRRCNNHIGWKFTMAEPNLKPEKFFGLTRKAIRYTYNEDNSEGTDQNKSTPEEAIAVRESISTE